MNVISLGAVDLLLAASLLLILAGLSMYLSLGLEIRIILFSSYNFV